MTLFSDWFNVKKEIDKDSHLWLLTEKDRQRPLALKVFCQTVRSHYDDLNNIADDIAALGFEKAAKNLKEMLPLTKKARSGELGEIMATEFAEEKLGFKVPVRRLRYKDGREMALRGDDFIGIYYNEDENELILLKGESKSNAALNRNVVNDARTVLDRDNGRCTPISLLFVANRLLERDDASKRLGRKLRNEVASQSIGPENINHAFFTLTGNDPVAILKRDLNAADKTRIQNTINIRIPDHQQFIKEVFEKVADLGKS